MPRSSRPDASFAVTRADLNREPSSASLVDQIFAVISGAVQSKRVAPGTRMPSVRALAGDCNISRDTAARAYDKLVAQGVLEPRRGAGFYVRAPSARKILNGPTVRSIPFFSQTVDTAFRFKMTQLDPPPTLRTRSGAGYLPGSWMDEAEIAAALRAVSRLSSLELDRPGSPQGFLPLREQIDLKLNDLGIRANPTNIIVTNGATDALNLIIQRMIVPGELVLIEQPTHPILIDRLMACGADFAYVPRLQDGPDLATLRAICVQSNPRVFFCSSVLHNPTSTLMAPHIAFQLLRLAEEFDLTIIEDDTYSDLLPSSVSATRVASLDQLQRVAYVGSFSKTLPPSLRVGFLAAPPAMIEWLCVYRSHNCIAGNSLAERIVHRLLSEGNYRHHCEQVRSQLADVRPHVVQALRSLGITIAHEPDAGLYIWGNLGEGVDAAQLAAKLLAQGHLTAPGRLFSFEHASFMRFNVSETLHNGLLPALACALGREPDTPP